MTKRPLTAWEKIKNSGKDFPPRIIELKRPGKKK